jgi:hypothetical protein
MPVAVNAQLDLSADEEAQLADIFGTQPAKLRSALQPYASAALEEYARMFLGQRVFSRGSDLLEHRLLLLIRHAFDGRVPSDDRVSALFQTTPAQSRTMIRSVLAKYQYVLGEGLRATLAETLGAARKREGEDIWTAVAPPFVVDALNRALVSIDGTLPPLRKEQGTMSTFELQRSSYLRLCERFGVKPSER